MSNARAEFVQRMQCINCHGSALRTLSSGSFLEGTIYEVLLNDPWGENPLPYLEGHHWIFVQCEDCDQKFHRDILSPEWCEIKYTRWITEEAIRVCLKSVSTPGALYLTAVENTRHVLRLELLTRTLREPDSAVRILDFGCGHGEFLATCSQFGFDAYGVDRAAAKRANSKFARVYPVLGELSAAIGDDKFHVITLFETLEHVDDPRSILEALGKLIVPGGILVLETPDCAGVTHITREDSWKIQPLEHINAFTADTLRSIAQRCGFLPLKRPVAHVTTSRVKLLKAEVRGAANALGAMISTQQYFQKGTPRPASRTRLGIVHSADGRCPGRTAPPSGPLAVQPVV